MSSPEQGRRSLVLLLAIFLAVSFGVYGLARWHPLRTSGASSAPLVTGDPQTGQRVFAGACAGCHGQRAEGGVGPALAGNPIALAAAREVIRQGRGIMPAGLVSGADEAAVLGYLETILASP